MSDLAFAAWLECSRRSRVGVGMNRSARRGSVKSVKRFERSNGLDTALYKKKYLLCSYLDCPRRHVLLVL